VLFVDALHSRYECVSALTQTGRFCQKKKEGWIMHPKKVAFLLFVVVFTFSVLISVPLRAQVAGATLTGTISDPQGAAVVNAKVSVKNGATGIVTETATNSSGVYNLVNLKPADYAVTVSMTGFNTATTKVTLTVGAQQELSLALKVGEMNQLVEVTGAAPVIETENATLSGNVQSQQIVELPLNGRDWAQLATLEPGVVQVRPHEQVTQPGGNLRGLGNQMTIDGNRPTQNVYRLNGVIVNDYSNAGPGNVLGANLGVDAIQEFSVLTANYSAEYGFTSGGVINAITKSGTNQFHGSVFEFIRNGAFDSSDYLSGANKPHFVRNQFGASGGWKILADKAFIFGSYEGLRQRKGIPGSGIVLTQDARNGIIHDPTSGALLPALTGSCPFPNSTNQSPGKAAICVDNFMTSYINAFEPLPTPNQALVGPDTGLFVYSGAQAVTDNYFTLRGDTKISDKDGLFASYYRDHSSWSKPEILNQAINGYLLPNQSVALEETHVFSPAMVNSIRLGYTQSIVTNPGIAALNSSLLASSFGMTSAYGAIGLGGQGGSTGVPGITDIGGFSKQGGFSDWVQNFQVFDDASRTIGDHSLKFGFMFLRNHTDLVNGNGNGSAGFSSIAGFLQNEPTTVRMPTTPPFTAGNTKHYNRNSVFGGYVQDDWKMRSNLTINVGLRYEMSTIPDEINGKFILLPQLWSNPGNCLEDINGLPTSGCSGLRHKVFDSNPTLKNFEPRIGFAWDPFKTGKTSVRGGFGMFDVLPMPFMFGLNALQASPSGAELDLSAAELHQGDFPKGFPADTVGIAAATAGRWQYTDPNPRRNYVMQWNFNVQRQITTNTSITLAYAGSRGIHNPFQTDTLNTVFPTKVSAGWLFPVLPTTKTDPNGVIPVGTLVACSSSLIPAGSCGSDPTMRPTPTGIVPGLLVNPFVPNLLLSTIFQAQSWYNSFQANFAKKMSHGLQWEASFTWQKSFDTSSGSFAGDNYSSNPTAATPWWDLSITRGLSDFNITRNLSINWLWNIPTPASFSSPAGYVARGWGIGGVFEVSDGAPMWPLTGLNSDPVGQINQEPMSIPDLAPGCTPKNAVQPGKLQYLKPQCFILPLAPAGFDPTHTKCDQGILLVNPTLNPNTCANLLGHLPRNSIIGPGLINVDLSLVKDNPIRKISEAFNIQFRADFFNLLNRTNFAPPTDNLIALDPTPVGGFGLIDQPTQTPMREIQFSLKAVW
jgi:hypothetical protein